MGTEEIDTSPIFEGWWGRVIVRAQGTVPREEQGPLARRLEAFIGESWSRLCLCDECESVSCLQTMLYDFMIQRDTAAAELKQSKIWHNSKWKKKERMNEELRATAALLEAALVSELAACGLRAEDTQWDGVKVEKHQKMTEARPAGTRLCYHPCLRGRRLTRYSRQW